MGQEDLSKNAEQSFERAYYVYRTSDLKNALQELAVAERLSLATGNNSLLVHILMQRAGWLREAGLLDEREVVLDRIDKLLPKLREEDRSYVLSSILMERGIEAKRATNFVLAEKMLREAESEARRHAWGMTVLSDILANLSAVYHELGQLGLAQGILIEAVEIDRKVIDHRKLSSDLNMLGLLYDATGDHSTAELHLGEAQQIALDNGYVKEAADAVGNLATIKEKAGNLEAAEDAYKKVLEFYEQIGYKVEIVNTKSNLAGIASRKGDYQEARRLLIECVDQHLQLGNKVHAIYDLLNLATVESALGEVQNAYNHASSARDQAKSMGMLNVLWKAHWLVAQTGAAVLKATTAYQELFEGVMSVLKSYSDAAEVIEMLRIGVGRPEERELLFGDKEDLYGEAMLLAGSLAGNARKTDIAFMFSERSRARAFLDVMGSQRIQRRAVDNPLVTRRELLIKQIMNLEEGDENTASKLYDDLRLVRTQISAEQPSIAAITDTAMPSYQDIIEAIPENAALIEFFIGPGQKLTIFLRSSKSKMAMKTFDLGKYDLVAKIEQFLNEVKNGVEGVPTGRELWYILFHPIWHLLESVELLLIVPHHELHYLPFSALWFNADSPDGPERLYLHQCFGHSILPSAAFLPMCMKLQRPEIKRGNSLVLANPSGDLPYAEKEGEVVAKLLGVDPLIHKKATREALIGEYRELAVVHVASHGTYNEHDPLLSGVEMSDGLVTVENIMESNLSSSLLVLSGCVTGLAKRQPGDELIGLSRAAAFAGVLSVITSLFDVWDESSCEFFEYFYQALLQGGSKYTAISYSQQMLLRQKKFEHPVHWAPFSLLGDWN